MFILLIITSCNFSNKGKTSDFEEPYIKLLIRSPYGCTHVISVDENGKGKIKAGTEINNLTDFKGFGENLKDSKFAIDNKNDLQSLNDLANTIRDKELLKTDRPKDAVHYELYILGTKKIDAYGRKSEQVNYLRDMLSKHYPFEIDYSCESYIEN